MPVFRIYKSPNNREKKKRNAGIKISRKGDEVTTKQLRATYSTSAPPGF